MVILFGEIMNKKCSSLFVIALNVALLSHSANGADMKPDSALPPTAAHPYAIDKIRTPVPEPSPRINGAKVVGVRPGAPLHHQIAVSGQRPLIFKAKNLPEGLTLDTAKGQLKGSIAKAGSYPVSLTAQNSVGEATAILRIEVGEEICLTPPMGWNSWYVFSESVSQDDVKAMAEAMVKSGLADHGWSFINIDDCWQGARGGKYKALQGNERFPNMQQLCEDVHGLGLKIGIYSTPWMGSYAGFRGGSCLDENGDMESKAVPLQERLQPNQVFGRYPGSIDRKLNVVGPAWFCDADAKQWAEWGFDFVKYDWNPNDIPTTRRIAEGLRASGRDIILSLSNSAPFENAEELSKLAQLWRTTGDIHESWKSINAIGFSQDKWQKFTRPGHWNDPDMLQVGMIGTPNRKNAVFHRTKLTPDEQYTQMSLWCLLGAPLLLSCDLRQLEPFTLNLLCNDEVLAINQDPLGRPAKKCATQGVGEMWSRELEDGSVAVGIFNRDDQDQKVPFDSQALFGAGRYLVRDLWRQKDCLPNSGETVIALEVKAHGVELLRVTKK